ncbi:MAG: Glutamine-hydrolyzing GMP synthase [Candidatus Gottesmanbacteria bacterium GW2011_GWB1_43_11]|uniref:GMP synthase [glutamine-hydrolyzing] n=1 Tax=Candidatus Gottesmanbacteria bacterium GW2011_GWB1_43_11 TaxID=1618446 RepID=A0A0G1CQC9_9BACT|nr:MAG: Glutamine-hydrolyzing GMP synthase [Candidatus Gottesmanbacteria bacterium GW2011_GWC1_43_10]KKS87652.1 MAG: Glutamine-hydrolyzing GMP synthase [Candidatus Gottesmanbacteria bacterium GW2011_GWB1_43_11]
MMLIVDFGSQTANLIARRIRDLGVTVTTVIPEQALAKIKELDPRGIIFSGGPASVYGSGAPTIDPKIFSFKIPILGICYGQQLTGFLLQGEVKAGKVKEYGPAIVHVNEQSGLFSGFTGKPFQVWMSHGDQVVTPPPGFHVTASTNDVHVAAMHNTKRHIYCVQFHPEVEHTRFGKLILRNFIENICGLKIKKHRLDLPQLITRIKHEIGQANALCAVSGGVDSTVAAALVARAVGKQLIPVYIESGLMRTGTKEEVTKLFTESFHIKPVIVKAQAEFLKALTGLTDPEDKRRAIGALYIKLFHEEAKKHKGADVLVQGTIYSDVIESKGTKHAAKIKSHHNVGGLPKELGFKLVEPLREFYKDEVRKIGRKLGLPPKFVQKQVFPGPGLAIRIVGEVTRARLAQEHQADQIILEEMAKSNWLKKVYMCFPIMTGAPSTAVKGDGRFFGEVVALRIIESKDVMTTNWAHLPYSLLQKLSSRIVNEVPGVSRVVYDITTKPPATMEWE